MTLNDIQKMDFNNALKKISYLTVSDNTEHLDINGIENRIQQTIGILNLLEKLNLKDDSFRKIMINALKSLYQLKRKLLYGYVDSKDKYKEFVSCN